MVTTTLFILLVLVLLFLLFWRLIGIIPLSTEASKGRWLFYALLILIAIVVLLAFIPGFHFPKLT